MITFECVYIKDILECASFSISEGSSCVILTASEPEKISLLKVFTGLLMPDSGRISFFNKDISSVSHTELNQLRQKIGIVPADGGLVSNLKVWENIMLPLMYHRNLSQQAIHDVEEKMKNIMNKLDYDDEITRLPGHLPIYKKRLAGLVRAMLMEPDIIIYNSVLEGLGSDIKEKVIKIINTFHTEKKGRVSLFISSDERLLNDIKADSIYMLKYGRFNERD
ncbi:MAG: ATP-binding cassette domain-containing protein [Nitrospirae bacterium]|nr:ATP-binding cassette domain-containing protein [Nitrospirota bacterium]